MITRRPWPPVRPSSRLETLCLDLVLLVMCSLALIPSLRATSDLDWPYDIDLYRDIAHAQTIRDGSFWDDPLYLGETVWYNPLVPALVAGLSYVTNSPVHRVYTRSGAYLNLLAPIAFYLMAAQFLGRWTALAGAFAFLFIMSLAGPPWLSATYSPWLFASSFVQILFYLSLRACRKAVQEKSPRAHFLAGVWLGITFLGHAAPAVILTTLLVALGLEEGMRSWRRGWAPDGPRSVLARYGTTFAVALFVSTPFLASIVGHYHLHVRNSTPGAFVPAGMGVGYLVALLPHTPFAVVLAAGVFLGLAGLYLQPPRPVEGRIFCLWLTSTLAFFVYGLFSHTLRLHRIHLPNPVPAIHFFFYLKAAEAVLLGVGIVFAGHGASERIGAWLSRRAPRSPTERARAVAQWERILIPGVLLAAFLAYYPRYLRRDDFVEFRREAEGRAQTIDTSAYHWIRQHSEPRDVFLAAEQPSMFLVGPAGRKVVVVGEYHSNPYVDWGSRVADRDRMLHAVQVGDRQRFGALAAHYHVTHVLVENEDAGNVNASAASFLRREFRGDKVTIYRVSRTTSEILRPSRRATSARA